MSNGQDSSSSSELSTRTSHQVGYYAALLTAIMTVITFGFAMVAVPIAGANCPGECVAYPYMDTASQFPRDFLWMPLDDFSQLHTIAFLGALLEYLQRRPV